MVNEIIKEMRQFIVMLALMLPLAAGAQNISVSGNVTDASTGEPVPFASVHLEGTMIGTSTDHEGHYHIEVKVSASGNTKYKPYSEIAEIDVIVR
jgi:hypothetical protein